MLLIKPICFGEFPTYRSISVTRIHFREFRIDRQDDVFHFHLTEKNTDAQDPERETLLSKGFFPTIIVQDFPIRGHKVFLHIKRRRWLNIQTGKVAYRDWIKVGKGTQMASELKDISLIVRKLSKVSM